MADPAPIEAADLVIDQAGEPPEVVLRTRGELDLHTAPILRDALRRAATGGTQRIVVDCRALDFVDSAGLRAILVARHELAADGVHVVIARPSPAVERVLDMTNLRDSLSE